jgi:hypothetical protein
MCSDILYEGDHRNIWRVIWKYAGICPAKLTVENVLHEETAAIKLPGKFVIIYWQTVIFFVSSSLYFLSV